MPALPRAAAPEETQGLPGPPCDAPPGSIAQAEHAEEHNLFHCASTSHPSPLHAASRVPSTAQGGPARTKTGPEKPSERAQTLLQDGTTTAQDCPRTGLGLVQDCPKRSQDDPKTLQDNFELPHGGFIRPPPSSKNTSQTSRTFRHAETAPYNNISLMRLCFMV